jgi:thioredoxin 1
MMLARGHGPCATAADALLGALCLLIPRRCRGLPGLGLLRAAAVVAGALLVLAVGGCASKDVRPIDDFADFQHQILTADRPVLVDFYKGACPTCVTVEPMLNQLADEYRGKVNFMRFELMKPYFEVTSEKIRQQYKIQYFPTQILFIRGQARYRWVLDYNLDDYRSILDQAVVLAAKQGPRVAPSAPVTVTATPPAQKVQGPSGRS